MDFRIWQPPEGISAEEKKDLWLEYLDRTPRPINSPLDLDQIVQEIKLTHSRGTRHEIDYNFSVRGVKPCWDDGLMDRVIYANINLASNPKRLGALLNKCVRLAKSLFNGELDTDVKCITINDRVDRHKIFVWTKKGLSPDDLVRIRDLCQDITNRCEQQIELVWDIRQY